MTDAAIISGSLVDVRNVGSAKSVKLTVHVPEEYARKVIDAFGWPTGATPVSVAIARLDERKVMPSASKYESPDTTPRTDQSVGVPAGADNLGYCVAVAMGGPRCVGRCEVPKDCGATPLPADKPKKSPAQIAGYLCTLGSFQTFLRERFTDQWIPNANPGRSKEEVAKETLYDICTVTSRTQLTKDNTEWLALQLAFKLWEAEAEVVPA
jgi:hypothetical protein